jgi:hypothetical protein
MSPGLLIRHELRILCVVPCCVQLRYGYTDVRSGELASLNVTQDGHLRTLALRGVNVASRATQRAGSVSQLLGSALGELLAALALAECEQLTVSGTRIKKACCSEDLLSMEKI